LKLAAMSDSPAHDVYAPLVPVPAEKRRLGFRDAFALWFSLGIGLLVLQAGALLMPGLSPVQAGLAILGGSAIGAVLLALAGVVGQDTGLATIAALRPALGIHGAAVPALLNVVQLVGWGAFEIIVMRDAANTLSNKVFGLDLPMAWTVLFGAAATFLAVMGPLSFIRRILRRWGVYLLLIGAMWMTWALLSRQDLSGLLARRGDGSLSFGGGIDLVAAMPLSWLPLIADYSRFGKTAKGMFRGSAAGYLLANVWFFALGAAYAMIASRDTQGAMLSALATTGGGLALLLVLIDETDNVFADIFSAATSTGTLIRVRVSHLAIGFGALCTVIALFVPMQSYEQFLIYIGSVFAPLYGVLLTDHFLIRKRRINAADIDRMDGEYGHGGIGFHMSAFAAWVAGVAVYYGINQFLPALGATLPSLAAAAAVYWGFKRAGT
jgi:NCS1 family nucleobase:cation symporter-1